MSGLVVVFERSVGRLGNGSVEHPDWCPSESSPDERSEDIASLVLQISEITSFVFTTHLRQTPEICIINVLFSFYIHRWTHDYF